MSMVVKKELHKLKIIREILENQHGIIFTSDLVKFNIPRVYLLILVKNGEIERISRGIYQSVNTIEDEMYILQAKYQSSIFSHETALYLHDLSDRTPLTYSISVPVGYHSISLKKTGYKVFYVNQKLVNLGVTIIGSPHGNDIKTYNLERTICDILRSRNQIDIQVINDAIKRYVGRKERNLDLLYKYAKQFRIQRIVRETIEVLL